MNEIITQINSLLSEQNESERKTIFLKCAEEFIHDDWAKNVIDLMKRMDDLDNKKLD